MNMVPKYRFNVDRRSGIDRRNQVGISFRSLLLGGRRENIRRKIDKQKRFHVDQYSAFFFAAIVIILTLSVVDALLTLFLIGNGAFELNPIMAYYIKIGPYWFLAVKYGLTSIGVVSLLMLRIISLSPFRIYTGSLLFILTAVFITVFAWQLYLIHNVII